MWEVILPTAAAGVLGAAALLLFRRKGRRPVATGPEAVVLGDAGPDGARALRLLGEADEVRAAEVAEALLAARPWTPGPRTAVAVGVVAAAARPQAASTLLAALEVCDAESVANLADAVQLVAPGKVG